MEDCVTISSCIRICPCQDYQQHCASCRLKVYHFNLVCFKQIPLFSGGYTRLSYPGSFAKYFKFDDNNWIEIGSFETPRRYNGLSVVDGTDVCRDSGQNQLITLNLTVNFNLVSAIEVKIKSSNETEATKLSLIINFSQVNDDSLDI